MTGAVQSLTKLAQKVEDTLKTGQKIVRTKKILEMTHVHKLRSEMK